MPEAQKANISIFKYYDNDAMDAMPIEKKRKPTPIVYRELVTYVG